MDFVRAFAKSAAGARSPFTSDIPAPNSVKPPAAPKATPKPTPAPSITPAPTPTVPPPTVPPPGAPPTTPLAPLKPVVAPTSPPPPPPPATVQPTQPVRPVGPTAPVPGAAPATNPDMTKFFESMAPHMMKQVAPTAGAVGGMPLLMMLWDLMGGSHGKNIQTIFGGGQEEAQGTGAALGAAAAGPPAGPPGPPPPAAPAPVAGQAAPPPAPAPAAPGPAVGPPPSVGAALGQAAGGGGGSTDPLAPVAPDAMAAFRTGGGYTTNHPDFQATRSAFAEARGMDPAAVPDDQVWTAMYNVNRDGGVSGAVPQPGQPPANAAERAREWFKRNTNTGTVGVGGVQVDPGRIAADGVAPQLLMNGVGKAVSGKAPGMVPAAFALDGLDLVGGNPFSDRFGKGTMGYDEALAKGEQTAQAPALLRGLTGATQPLTTLYSGGTMVNEAGKALDQASASQDDTIRMERARMQQTGQAPSLKPTAPNELAYVRHADGTHTRRSFGDRLGQVHQKAWEDSYIPGVNYISAMAESATENSLATAEEYKQRNLWREWAREKDQALQQQATAAPDPAQQAAAQAELDKLRAEREQMKSTTGENLDRNMSQRSIAHPLTRDFWRGNWHMPWSSDVD